MSRYSRERSYERGGGGGGGQSRYHSNNYDNGYSGGGGSSGGGGGGGGYDDYRPRRYERNDREYRERERDRDVDRYYRERDRQPMNRSRSRDRYANGDSGAGANEGGRNGGGSVDDVDEDDGYRVHVADLTDSVSQYEIEKAFRRFGEVREVWLAKNPPCFSFIVFKRKEDAAAAVAEMDQQ